VIFVAVIVIVAVSINWRDIEEHFFDPAAAKQMLPEVFTVALRNTIIYALTGYVFGFLLGLILALMRLSSVAPYRWVALIYIEIFRGLPLLLVLLLIAFGLPVAFPGLEFPFGHYGQGAVGLGLVAAAYLAETLRAGIQAIPRGQMEAARSLGMSRSRAMVSIILPQAVRRMIPPFMNEFATLIKLTTLGSVLAVSELLHESENLINNTYRPLEVYTVVAIAFGVIIFPIIYLSQQVERAFKVRS
jgi:polar amino acid transport system permease protein